MLRLLVLLINEEGKYLGDSLYLLGGFIQALVSSTHLVAGVVENLNEELDMRGRLNILILRIDVHESTLFRTGLLGLVKLHDQLIQDYQNHVK